MSAGNVFKMVNTETGAVLKEFKDQPETLHHALAVDTYSRRVYTGGTRFSMLRLPTDDSKRELYCLCVFCPSLCLRCYRRADVAHCPGLSQ